MGDISFPFPSSLCQRRLRRWSPRREQLSSNPTQPSCRDPRGPHNGLRWDGQEASVSCCVTPGQATSLCPLKPAGNPLLARTSGWAPRWAPCVSPSVLRPGVRTPGSYRVPILSWHHPISCTGSEQTDPGPEPRATLPAGRFGPHSDPRSSPQTRLRTGSSWGLIASSLG